MTEAKEDEFSLPDWATPGQSFEDRTRPNRRVLWHIRGIVDDQVIARRWHRGKGWRYDALDPVFFHAGFRLRPIGSPRRL